MPVATMQGIEQVREARECLARCAQTWLDLAERASGVVEYDRCQQQYSWCRNRLRVLDWVLGEADSVFSA